MFETYNILPACRWEAWESIEWESVDNTWDHKWNHNFENVVKHDFETDEEHVRRKHEHWEHWCVIDAYIHSE